MRSRGIMELGPYRANIIVYPMQNIRCGFMPATVESLGVYNKCSFFVQLPGRLCFVSHKVL